jgi:hypothetical protein
MAKNAIAAQANAFLGTRPVNAIAPHHTHATWRRIVNVSVPTSAAKMTIALVIIRCARATIPACLCLRILLPANAVAQHHIHVTWRRIVNVSVPTSAVKMAIVLAIIKCARTTIPACLSLRIPLPVNAIVQHHILA